MNEIKKKQETSWNGTEGESKSRMKQGKEIRGKLNYTDSFDMKM